MTTENPKFIHLRAQSSYSMLESALKISTIVAKAKADKMPAVCMADRGNLFGSLEFAMEAVKAGVQPICGTILNIKYNNSYAEIVLIAKDEIGYSNLLKLASYVFIKNDRNVCNHITFEDIESNSDGIIALSGYTDGIIGKHLIADDFVSATEYAKRLKGIFADRFYIEIMRHDLPEETLIEPFMLEIAATLDIPVVATNNVLFENKEMTLAHEILLCISAGMTLEDDRRKVVSQESYFKSQEEMAKLFSDIPEVLENTVYLAQRCHVMARQHEPMLPKIDNEIEVIKQQATDGLLARLAVKFASSKIDSEQEQEIIKQEYFARLEYELDIICRMNFSGYFLIVSDFIRWSKQQGIPVGPGRGSGAGSIVAWSLFITDLDPIKFGLLFERFLNPERISMPDFDIDFCQERRSEVIEYVRHKYGDSRVGQIITFGKLQAKAVIKDVARVLGLRYEYADYLTKLVPFNAVNPVTLDQAIEEVPELKDAASGKGLYNLKGEQELLKEVLANAIVLEGLHRHASVHAAGIVIAGKDLVEILPVYKDNNSEMLTVQYSMKYAEAAGLVKFDFLGLQTLTVISNCQKLVKNIRGIDIDFENMTLFDDSKTYEMLSHGSGIGVFQFESIGMRDTLKRLKPDCINDLIALGALYRPGPMENIPTYIACKHKRQEPNYLHPCLKDILEATNGVIIYQEQVLEIAKVMAGYSLGKADLLRRAMGKKIKSEMQAQEEMFVSGAIANNIPEEQAKSIFATVAKFAGYGFNKAHASAYGVISYQTAYLKANFLVEFLVACLNLELNDTDKINLFIQEAKNNNVQIIPPSINKSSGCFGVTEDHKGIIFALGAIKGVTPAFGNLARNEVEKNGKFKNIIDFIERIDRKLLNQKTLESLIKAGAFDELHPNRNSLLLSIPKLIAYSESYAYEQQSNQFSLIKISSNSKDLLLNAEVLDANIDAFNEFEVLGLFLTYHPLLEYQELLKKAGIYNSLTLHTQLSQGSNIIKLAGVIQKKDARMSGRGRFITLQLSDPFGIFELAIYSDETIKKYVHLLNVKTIVIIEVEAFYDEGGVRITAKHFYPIESLTNVLGKIDVKINNYDHLAQVIDCLRSRTTDDINKKNIDINLLLDVKKDFIAKVNLASDFNVELSDISLLTIVNSV